MPIQTEVNLRIPAVKEPRKDAQGYPINSANVRFIRSLTAGIRRLTSV